MARTREYLESLFGRHLFRAFRYVADGALPDVRQIVERVLANARRRLAGLDRAFTNFVHGFCRFAGRFFRLRGNLVRHVRQYAARPILAALPRRFLNELLRLVREMFQYRAILTGLSRQLLMQTTQALLPRRGRARHGGLGNPFCRLRIEFGALRTKPRQLGAFDRYADRKTESVRHPTYRGCGWPVVIAVRVLRHDYVVQS